LPRLPTPGCSWPLCPERAAREGFCAKHFQERSDLANQAQRGGSALLPSGGTGRWGLIRRMQLAKEPLCREHMKESIAVVATNVDHVVPRAMGGGDEETNLQSLCDEHKKLKDKEERMLRRTRC